MKIPFSASLLLSFAFTAVACHGQEKDKPSPIGYEDTPVIPGTEWRVHDIKRPAPPVVKPGKTNDDAPADAVIIFNGGSTDALVSKEGKPCPWKVENGELLIAGGDCWTKEQFASCQLHIEWMSAPNTKGNSQKKGNAGVFFMDKYESQMMDNDNNPTYADGMTGSIYGQTPPMVNAVRKAGEWQTYDIIFTAPKLKDGKVVEPAYITTFVNGVCVQNHTKIMGPTKHKNITNYDGDFPEKGAIRLQDHKNDPPVRVRNYWVRPL